MNSMMVTKKIIVTNLRVPDEDWNQLKAIAAERGMSANEYVNLLMRNVITPQVPKKRGGRRVWDMPELAKRAKSGDGLAVDDEVIYG